METPPTCREFYSHFERLLRENVSGLVRYLLLKIG